MKNNINQNVKQAKNICLKLRNAGFQSFFVGGFVRDFLINGRENSDIDIVTSAKPDEIISLFSTEKVDLVGKSFGVVLINGYEVSTYRKDTYFGLSDKNCLIEPGTFESDASRRDFTVNSIYLDPFSDLLIDPNGGIDDLKKKIICLVGDDPHNRICEDPNRIIRACRFLAKIDGSFDYNTKNILLGGSALGYPSKIDSHRIRLEVMKAMEIPQASKFFEALELIKALGYVFPAFLNCNVDGGQHHRETVFEHSMLVGDAISCKFPLLKLAGYLHDLGKPAAKGINPLTGEVWFKGHEDTSAELAKGNLEVLKFSNDEANFIFNVIKMHMRISDGMGGKAIRRLLRDCKEVKISHKDLLRLWMADRAGNKREGVDRSLTRYKVLVRKFWKELGREKLPLSVKDLEVDGDDVINVLNISPSQRVGMVLKQLLEEVLEDPDKNERGWLLGRIKEMELVSKCIDEILDTPSGIKLLNPNYSIKIEEIVKNE